MKITYALIAACLSLQACNDHAPTASFDTSADIVDEYNVGAIAPPAIKATSIEEQYAVYWIDTARDDHTATVPPAIKPIDGAASRFDDSGIDWRSTPTTTQRR